MAKTTEKYYYKIINKNTKNLVCYIQLNLPIKEEKICEILCLNGYYAKSVTKEEYVKRKQ